MNNVATMALRTVNWLVLALLVAYGVVDSLSPFGDVPSLRPVVPLLVIGVPHAVLLVGLRKAVSPWWTGVALVVNGIWVVLLVIIGAVSATGLGGAAGLLLVVVPDFLVVCMNVLALARRLRGRGPTGRPGGAPSAPAEFQR